MPESLSDVKGLPIGMLILNFPPHIVGINWRVQLRILDVQCLELPRATTSLRCELPGIPIVDKVPA